MADVTTVTGIILSAMPVGEFDRRLVILTKECGKISAFAKGARRQNSSLIGVTRPFIFGTFEVYRGRDSYSMYKAEVSNYFENVTEDLEAVCYACYFSEIADYFGRENLDASDMINLLYISLRALANPNIPNRLVRCIYEIRMTAINGECPDFFTCHECGKEDGIIGFSMFKCGMYCKDCSSTIYDGIVLNQSTMYALQYVVTSPLKKLYTFNVTGNVLDELRQVTDRICRAVIDKELKSKEMLDAL